MGGGDSYGDTSGQKCYPTYETKYKEQCESYDEKVCYTTHLEACEPVLGKKCKAIQTSKQDRKCFDVNELLCSLKENVQYEEVPAVFTVQKCHKIKERVCDTVYETELTEKDDYKCITVVNPYCAKKDRTVYDKTCRTMINFDCKAQGGNSYGAGSNSNGNAGYGTTDEGYGESNYQPEYKCHKSHETKCYTTPRTVASDYCEDREEKVCEIEERSQPKQVKKYVYHKECRPVPKTVCDNADQKFLKLSCVPSSRKECSYHPEESCENVPKEHCYQIPYQVKKMECSPTYGTSSSDDYSSTADE